LSICLILLFFISIDVSFAFAESETFPSYQEETFVGMVVKIVGERRMNASNESETQVFQMLEVRARNGSKIGQIINLESGDINQSGNFRYKEGDQIVVSSTKDASGVDNYLIVDFVRTHPMLILFLLFIFVTIIIGK
jgi:uncharacterized membrane protein